MLRYPMNSQIYNNLNTYNLHVLNISVSQSTKYKTLMLTSCIRYDS